MANTFRGTIEDLKNLINSANIIGNWSVDLSGKQTFRTRDGGVLNWWPSKFTVQIQGLEGAKPQLQRLFENQLTEKNTQSPSSTVKPSNESKPTEVVTTETAIGANLKSNREPVLGHKFTSSELIIALVGAVGTKTKTVGDILSERLATFGYDVHEISISRDVIPKVVPITALEADEFSRISKMMDCGDEARETANDNAILALGAATRIAEIRANLQRPHRKSAFLITSLKRPEEVRRLREIYPRAFYLVGVHSDETRRMAYLVDEKRMTENKAKLLIKRDEDEDTDFGQRLSDTFHMSDFFVRVDGSEDRLKNSLWRFLEILFGSPHRTPTFDEYAMFLAFSASLRSADLSRQVGSVIARDREILATGANDCPRAGGGLYWPEVDDKSGQVEDVGRGRDYKRGLDSNRDEQQKMVNEIIKDAGNELLDLDALRRVLGRSRILDLTEFGRVVHAEMEALLSCARNELATRAATIYCTTFPCHNCAKHIIAAGIERVVFVEPYQKSKAAAFHDDAITIGFDKPLALEDEKKHLVRFEPFVGVGPRRFFDLFSMKLGLGYELERKTPNGKTSDWRPETAVLRVQMLPYSYRDVEAEAAELFNRARPQMD